MDRVFFMGNSGSGKSWLTQQLAQRRQYPVFHLDDFHWLPNFMGERPRDERNRLAVQAQAAEVNSWIMEGIYGSILRQVLSQVTTLAWLDIPDSECVSNLRQRGQAGGGAEEQFEELLEYTRGYRVRKSHMNSFDAHERFFEECSLQKLKLGSRSDVTAFSKTF